MASITFEELIERARKEARRRGEIHLMRAVSEANNAANKLLGRQLSGEPYPFRENKSDWEPFLAAVENRAEQMFMERLISLSVE